MTRVCILALGSIRSLRLSICNKIKLVVFILPLLLRGIVNQASFFIKSSCVSIFVDSVLN